MFQTILNLYDVFVGDIFDKPVFEWKLEEFSTDPYLYLHSFEGKEKTELKCSNFCSSGSYSAETRTSNKLKVKNSSNAIKIN
ncbi:MAG: hypothetical protein GX896_09830 [Clostridiales bacterium]|nr:hypothetical protein [Clostridiales bacterium]